MKISIMTSAEAQQKFLEKNQTHHASYAAMYSTWLGGIVKDPSLMLVPIDDHIVHRGDGVFEAMKCIESGIYLLEEHLDRLLSSGEGIALKLPMSRSELKAAILQTLQASELKEAIIRLFWSRGPGSFSPNPYDSVGNQLYIVITSFKPLPDEKYLKGVRIGRSAIPVKEDWLAITKSCNYLPNVMMKKESVDRGLDFTVSFDRNNFLAESSTENIMIVSNEGKLVHPMLEHILSGTTMHRAFDLAKVSKINELTGFETRNITEEEILNAREVMMVGTTLDVLPVTEYENQKIGLGASAGQVGPVAQALLQLLREDIIAGPKRTQTSI